MLSSFFLCRCCCSGSACQRSRCHEVVRKGVRQFAFPQYFFNSPPDTHTVTMFHPNRRVHRSPTYACRFGGCSKLCHAPGGLKLHKAVCKHNPQNKLAPPPITPAPLPGHAPGAPSNEHGSKSRSPSPPGPHNNDHGSPARSQSPLGGGEMGENENVRTTRKYHPYLDGVCFCPI
jgi:hypothetical protein